MIIACGGSTADLSIGPPSPALACGSSEATITLTGSGVAPLVVDALDEATVALPAIALRPASTLDGADPDAAELELGPPHPALSWLDEQTLSLELDLVGAAPGIYAVVALRPEGGEVVADGPLVVTAPPTVSGLDPSEVCQETSSATVTLTGEGLLVLAGEPPMVTVGGQEVEVTPYVDDTSDCDDTDAAVNPSADEVCNGIDDDCDSLVDDDDPGLTDASTWYRDADGDGYGRSDTTTDSCSAESGWVADATDCDDDEASANPAGSEVCDGLDNDCDGSIDDEASDAETFYADADGDGFGDPDSMSEACTAESGFVSDASDCDDTNGDVNPDADELCNGIDDDCSGDVDDDPVDLGSWYVDDDGDGFGSDETVEACDQPSGSSTDDGDCDDGDAAVNPDAEELCNELDDDCDGYVDDDDPDLADASTWYLDHDGDGYGDPAFSAEGCEAPASYVDDDQDCDDLDAEVNPELVWYADGDGDGFGDADDSATACEQPSGRVADDTDCDDGDGETFPGAPEVCDASVDADCDGVTPDGCTSCLEILDSGGSSGDGLYPIDPDGPDGELDEVEVWCDMSTDGGGWTLVQRTVWDWSESSQLETDYATWYADTLGSADEGYAFRLAGVAWPEVATEGELLMAHALRTTEGGACDPLYYDGSFSGLDVSEETATWDGFSGSATLVNDDELSTTDSGPSPGCVTGYDAVPWFYSWCCTTCPTFKGGYWTDEAHPMASYTGSASDLHGNYEDDVCGGAEVRMNDNGSSYRGVDDMGVYLR